ncbi:cell division protein FtsZ [Porphyrobacter sp. GA68]|uniref:cell division protein FtsZ n=1 Tax=Porphyrobacter sp. GA68 TaxID=2883480 RepID=UPI001D184B42|nr:cell division protein FtsZ [Porphyrobacter sp. GA68]
MSINIGPAPSDELRPKIMVVGVGGAGGNAVANMLAAGIEGVEFIVANTDAQALSNSAAEHRIQLGPNITGGLGAGARPEVGKAAAEETSLDIEEALDSVNMVFIAAGMGGGTGTGAAPVIAEAARRKGVLTVGVVTKPFQFEGTRRMRAAEAGIAELQKHVDTLIVIPNQNLFLVAKPETTFKEAFQLADEVLQQGVRSITDLMVMPGLINLDFADVRSVMQEMGKAMMGTGEGEGENRALEAAEKAIANPLLDGVSMAGAKGVIISIIGGEDMKLLEVDEAANHIRDLVDEDANIIWGSAFNPDLEGKIRVSVVATGIDNEAQVAAAEAKPFVLADARAPRRPALDFGQPQETPTPVREPLDLGNVFSEQPAGDKAGLVTAKYATGLDEDEEEFDDVDGIVDPLAGLRQDDDDDFGSASQNADQFEEPLDLAGMAADPEDSRGASVQPISPLQTKPQGRRRLVPGEIYGGAREGADRAPAGAAGTASAGSTLFERMANLSRGAQVEDDDEDDRDDDGPALNIPRFLGRQNNQ